MFSTVFNRAATKPSFTSLINRFVHEKSYNSKSVVLQLTIVVNWLHMTDNMIVNQIMLSIFAGQIWFKWLLTSWQWINRVLAL